MKKINPRVIGLAIMLLSTLIASGLAIQKVDGDVTLMPDPPDDTGTD